MGKTKENALEKLAQINTEAAKKTLQTNAEQIFDVLKSSRKYDELTAALELLEKFAFRVHEEAISALKAFLDRLENLEIEYPEDYHVRYATNLVVKALDVLFVLRFMDVERITEIIFSYLDSDDPDVSKRSGELAKQYASYDLRALNKIGYYPQKIIVDALAAWDISTLVKRREPVNTVCCELLNATAEATSSDYKTVTWHTGSLVIDDGLKEIRSSAISLLIELYKAQNDIPERLRVMRGLRSATTLPRQTPYNDDWIELAKENFSDIADFYLSIFDDCSFLEYQEMEHQIYWFPKRGIKFADSEKVVSELSKKLSENEEYQIFRMIMGDDRSFSSYWEEAEWSFKKSREFRKQKIDEYMPLVGADFDVWRERAISCLEHVDDTSSGVYEFMPYFLKRLAEEYPDHAESLLKNDKDKFVRYLPSLLIGLMKSSPEKACAVSEAWLEQGTDLETIMRCHDIYGDREQEFIERTLDRAIEVKDEGAQKFALSVLAKNHELDPKFYAEHFLKCVTALREENHSWSNWVWFRPEAAKLIAELPDEEIDFLLDTLVEQNDIDYNEEDLLRPIAKLHPEKIIQLFEKRIEKQISERENDEVDLKYDAVPFSLNNLAEPLADNADVVMPVVFDWYKREDWLYRWDGARLLSNIFVNVDGRLQKFLIGKVQNGSRDDAIHALHILKEYQGNPEVFDVCVEALKKYPNDKDINSAVYGAFSATGVMSGEYGVRDAYKAKMVFVDEMMKIDDEGVKSFASEYKESLEKNIEYETQRADKDIAVRKKVWGVKDDNQSNKE